LAVENNALADKTSAVETLSNTRFMFGFPRLYACCMACYHSIKPASPPDIPSWECDTQASVCCGATYASSHGLRPRNELASALMNIWPSPTEISTAVLSRQRIDSLRP
jgi:hypothetical protein